MSSEHGSGTKSGRGISICCGSPPVIAETVPNAVGAAIRWGGVAGHAMYNHFAKIASRTMDVKEEMRLKTCDYISGRIRTITRLHNEMRAVHTDFDWVRVTSTWNTGTETENWETY